MAHALGIPIADTSLFIEDCSKKLCLCMNSILNTDRIYHFVVSSPKGNVLDNVLFGETEKKTITLRDFAVESDVMSIEPTEFSYAGRDYTSCFLYADVSKARNPTGFLLVSCIAICISREALGIIEDPAEVWVDGNFLSSDEFLERVKLPNGGKYSGDIFSLVQEFYSRLNISRRHHI